MKDLLKEILEFSIHFTLVLSIFRILYPLEFIDAILI